MVDFVLSWILTAVHSIHCVTDSLYVLLHRLVLCELSDASDNSNRSHDNNWSENFDARPHRMLCH